MQTLGSGKRATVTAVSESLGVNLYERFASTLCGYGSATGKCELNADVIT